MKATPTTANTPSETLHDSEWARHRFGYQNLTPQAFGQYVKRNGVPVVRIGRRMQFDAGQVEDFIRSRSTGKQVAR